MKTKVFSSYSMICRYPKNPDIFSKYQLTGNSITKMNEMIKTNL
ncbi:unnamed protein product [Acanthoscelides obtectus]|uniref:Uncharacterized protein n=1 Tax=Acanthoscelides obtectus TaxID=200917 RepID=A0A9P0Q1E9_ACAOB|nr:unnamed protein product [Acanthoscelides obtectus]CAK1622558.1 hypothetical protein AOBTE_LOCUS1560 [Acanthoscelides obtectus]